MFMSEQHYAGNEWERHVNRIDLNMNSNCSYKDTAFWEVIGYSR